MFWNPMIFLIYQLPHSVRPDGQTNCNSHEIHRCYSLISDIHWASSFPVPRRSLSHLLIVSTSDNISFNRFTQFAFTLLRGLHSWSVSLAVSIKQHYKRDGNTLIHPAKRSEKPLTTSLKYLIYIRAKSHSSIKVFLLHVGDSATVKISLKYTRYWMIEQRANKGTMKTNHPSVR